MIRFEALCLAALCGCATEGAPVQHDPQPSAAACTAPVGPAAVTPVDGPTARRLVAEGARLVDVRGPELYAREHIAGAINIPAAEVGERAAEIGPATACVVLYCRTGANSAKAAQTLASLGYTRVYDLGSYLNWGEGAPAPTPLPK